ncbi:flagellar basal body rod protein FlgB [Tolumonas lignilytica]|uniref:flagellar basal body rod protein FlgB n=1 Tax=Tolumonas lignilytica TaxID=1283284 RepID=UPI0004649A67|nr:flagellar basal body rod protein FlgB [Tolumonas lignilytica]
MAISFDKAFGIHQYTIGARSQRAEVLAANIANADTPGYKARDVDFSALLEQAQGGQSTAVALTRTNEQHIAGGSSLDSSVMYRTPLEADTGDGNTVDINQERTAFMENSLEFQTSLSFLNSKISVLMRAIKGDSA